MKARLAKKCVNKWISKYDELHKKYSKVREEASALEDSLIKSYKEYEIMVEKNRKLSNKINDLAYENKILEDEINELLAKKWWKIWKK